MDWSSPNAFWEWLSSLWATIVPPAAINFPTDPVDGQQFGRYAWNNTKGTWDFS
jgi:hypothetical protein